MSNSNIKEYKYQDIEFFNELLKKQRENGDIKCMIRTMQEIRLRQLFPDIETQNNFIAAYCNNDDLPNALKIFSEMQTQDNIQPNIETFNLLINCYSKKNDVKNIIKLIQDMEQFDYEPTTDTLNFYLNTLVNKKEIKNATQVFESQISNPNEKTYQIMIEAYQQNHYQESQLQIFKKLIQIQAEQNQCQSLMKTYNQMLDKKLVPQQIIYSHIIRAHSLQGNVKICQQMVDDMNKFNVYLNTDINNSLIQAYIITGEFEKAVEVYQSISNSRNIETYNMMIEGYLKFNQKKEALRLAQNVLEEKISLDIQAYNIIIKTFIVNNKKSVEILDHQMCKSKVVPNQETYELLLQYYCQIEKFEKAKITYNKMFQNDVVASIQIQEQFIELCQKMRENEYALKIFDTMAFMKIIDSYKKNQNFDEFYQNIFEMIEREIRPNEAIISRFIESCGSQNISQNVTKLVITLEQNSIQFNENNYYYLIEAYAKSKDYQNTYKSYRKMLKEIENQDNPNKTYDMIKIYLSFEKNDQKYLNLIKKLYNESHSLNFESNQKRDFQLRKSTIGDF